MAGMRLTYNGENVRVRPIITEQVARDNAKYLEGINMSPVDSRINRLGNYEWIDSRGVYVFSKSIFVIFLREF